MYNAVKKPVDLRVLIDEEMFKVDENDVPKLFITVWNEVVVHTYPEAVFEGDIIMDQWRWAIVYSVVAVRHTFSTSIRMQFSDDDVETGEHLPDDNEEDHAYYYS